MPHGGFDGRDPVDALRASSLFMEVSGGEADLERDSNICTLTPFCVGQRMGKFANPSNCRPRKRKKKLGTAKTPWRTATADSAAIAKSFFRWKLQSRLGLSNWRPQLQRFPSCCWQISPGSPVSGGGIVALTARTGPLAEGQDNGGRANWSLSETDRPPELGVDSTQGKAIPNFTTSPF